MLRIATMDDLAIVLDLALKFSAASAYKDYIEADKVEALIKKAIEISPKEGIVILYEDKAFIGALKAPFVFGSVPVATEIAWWVEPELRKQGIGDLLVAAFEEWAKQASCKLATLAFLDMNLSRYMEKKGYTQYESAHYKVL